MKIFVINLKKSVERKKHIERQLKILGLDYKLMEAVDGGDLSADELKLQSNVDLYMQHPTWKNRGKGMIGCALSHHNIYKEIVQNNISRALIFEDDIFIKKDISTLINIIDEMTIIDSKELILLAAHSIGEDVQLSSIHKRALNNKYALYYVINIDNLWSATAYSISYESAKKFLEVYPKVERAADVWGAFYEKNVFSTVSCVAPFSISYAAFESDIGTYVEDDTLTFNIKAYVRNNIPFLYNILIKLKRKRDPFFDKTYVIKDEYSMLDIQYKANET